MFRIFKRSVWHKEYFKRMLRCVDRVHSRAPFVDLLSFNDWDEVASYAKGIQESYDEISHLYNHLKHATKHGRKKKLQLKLQRRVTNFLDRYASPCRSAN